MILSSPAPTSPPRACSPGPTQLHVCYCHTPARFAWDMQNQYLKRRGIISALRSCRPASSFITFANWDALSANRVDLFVSNSNCVGGRIRKTYRRESTTIYPPVDTTHFSLHGAKERLLSDRIAARPL